MEWYNILFLFVFTFFIIKTIITLTVGDTDIDFDADGDIDFDISSMFSFKGLLHFLLGFSSYLTIVSKFNNNVLNNHESNYIWIHYVIGIIVGIIFMFILYKLYQFMGKLNHYSDKEININNYVCSILINNGLVNDNIYSYTVLINTEIGSRKINVLSEKPNLKIGSEHKIYSDTNGVYYI